MQRFFRWAIGLPVFLLCMAFAVANRQWVVLSIDPFSNGTPSYGLETPLWLLLVAAVLLGIFIGWFFCWRAQAKWRRLARDRQKDIARLQADLARRGPQPAPLDDAPLPPLPGIM